MDEPPSLTFVLSISTDLGLTYPAIIFLVATLLLVSSIISASESAYASITHDQMDNFRKSLKDQTIVALLDHPDLLMITMTLLNTTVRVGLVSISVLILFNESQSLIPSGLATLLVMLIVVVIVDLIPRIYGKRYSTGFVRLTGGTWRILVMVFKPIIKQLVDLKRVTNRNFVEQGIEADELNKVLADNKGTADVEKDILSGIANFGKLTVSQVMHFRGEIAALDASSNFTVLMEYVNKCGFSRIPVYRNTLDSIEGILYIKDLLPFLDYPQDFQWQTLLRPGFVVRDSRKIDAMLRDFQEKRVHMAIVVDDQGKTIGLVTLEDLLEEIIGAVKDGFDDTDFVTTKKQNETLVVEDKTSLHEGANQL